MTKQKLQIFKVQVPLYGDPKALIYNEDDTIRFFAPITDDLLQSMDGQPKAFFYGFVANNSFHIKKEAPWQDW